MNPIIAIVAVALFLWFSGPAEHRHPKPQHDEQQHDEERTQ